MTAASTQVKTSFDKFKPHPQMAGVFMSVNLDEAQLAAARRFRKEPIEVSQFKNCIVWDGLPEDAARGLHDIVTYEERIRERHVI